MGHSLAVRVWAGCFVALVAFAPVAYSGAPELVAVPDIVGLTVEEAIQACESLGFVALENRSLYDPAVPIGSVMEQFPPSGTLLAAGKEVQYYPSLGPYYMPDLIGLDYGQDGSISSALFIADRIFEFSPSEDMPFGYVLDLAPPPGTLLTPATVCVITLSSGPRQYTSSDVNQNGVEDAQDIQLIINSILGVSTSDSGEDVNGDGDVNAIDLQQTIRAALGLLFELPELITVPEGPFEMGDPYGDVDSHIPATVHTVYLSAFEIGKYEITVEQVAIVFNWALKNGRFETNTTEWSTAFGQFVALNDPRRNSLAFTGGAFAPNVLDGLSMAKHPVTNIDWHGAAAFCNWLSEMEGLEPVYDTETWDADFSKSGYHLPTEAQWERAAAWDTRGSEPYHWRFGNSSDTISCENANFALDSTPGAQIYCSPLGATTVFTVPVKWYDGSSTERLDGRSPVGAYGMTGNVMELCHDRYDPYYYNVSPLRDPAGPAVDVNPNSRVLRGGGALLEATYCRSERRTSGFGGSGIGFRVAR